jgi:hypothetical protein
MSAGTRFAAALAGAALTAAALSPAASAEPAVAVTLEAPQSLVKFDTAMPSAATLQPIVGLGSKESLRGIDYRPATGEVYGYSSNGKLYTLDPGTGVAAARSRPSVGQLKFGVDFNPVVDRLRLVNNNGGNFRLNVDTGQVFADAPLNYASGDDNEGATPAITAAAYSNNFPGAGATVLYDIDSDLDILVTQAPPNSGTLNTIGSLGVPVNQDNGFDISGATGIAYGAFTRQFTSNLFRIDLGTGAATLVGPIGDGSFRVGGLTIVPAPAG